MREEGGGDSRGLRAEEATGHQGHPAEAGRRGEDSQLGLVWPGLLQLYASCCYQVPVLAALLSANAGGVTCHLAPASLCDFVLAPA